MYRDSYSVTYYRWDHTKSNMPICSMKRVVVFASRRLFDDTLAYAIRCNDNKFNPGDVLNMLISLHKREITNGVSIRPRKTDEHLTSEELLFLANAIFIHAYKLKYDVGRASKEIIKEVNSLRAYQNSVPVSKFLTVLKLSFRNLVDRLYGNIAELCFFWMNFPELFPVDIDKALTYIPAETYIQEHLPLKPLQFIGPPMTDSFNVDVDLDAEVIAAVGVKDITTVVDKLFDVDKSHTQPSNSSNPYQQTIHPTESSSIHSSILPPLDRFPFSEYPPYLTDTVLGNYQHFTVCCETNCNFVEHSVVGDGNCQFTSIIYASGIRMTVGGLRRQLRLFYDEVFGGDDESVINVIDKNDGDDPVAGAKWGNDKTLHLFSLCYGTRVYLHHYNNQDSIDYYLFGQDTFTTTIHLVLRNNHYTPLVKKLTGGFVAEAVKATKTFVSEVGKLALAASATTAIINVVDSRGKPLWQINFNIEDKIPVSACEESTADGMVLKDIRTKLIRSYFYNNITKSKSKYLKSTIPPSAVLAGIDMIKQPPHVVQPLQPLEPVKPTTTPKLMDEQLDNVISQLFRPNVEYQNTLNSLKLTVKPKLSTAPKHMTIYKNVNNKRKKIRVRSNKPSYTESTTTDDVPASVEESTDTSQNLNVSDTDTDQDSILSVPRIPPEAFKPAEEIARRNAMLEHTIDLDTDSASSIACDRDWKHTLTDAEVDRKKVQHNYRRIIKTTALPEGEKKIISSYLVSPYDIVTKGTSLDYPPTVKPVNNQLKTLIDHINSVQTENDTSDYITVTNDALTSAPTVLHFVHNKINNDHGLLYGYTGFAAEVAADVGIGEYIKVMAYHKKTSDYFIPNVVVTKGNKFTCVIYVVTDRIECFKHLKKVFFEIYNRTTVVVTVHTILLGTGIYGYSADEALKQINLGLQPYSRRIRLVIHVPDLSVYRQVLNILNLEKPSNKKIDSRLVFSKLNSDDYWSLTESDKMHFRRFKPEYILGDDKVTNMKNSIIERREISRVNDAILCNEMKDFFDRFVPKTLVYEYDRELLAVFTSSRLKPSLYNVALKKFVIKGSDLKPTFTHYFDGVRFLPSHSLETTLPYVLVCNATELMLEARKNRVLTTIDLTDFNLPVPGLVRGVPGCGKSTYIINKYSDDSIILTTTKAASLDLAERIKEKTKINKPLVYTIDSYLLNRRTKHKYMYVDEAIMSHAGDISAAIYFCQPERVE